MSEGRSESGQGKRLETVHRVWNDSEASLLKGLLEAHGIPVTLSSEVPHSVYPVSVNGLGEVRLQVPPALAETARSVLADYLAAGEPSGDESPEDGSEDR